MTSKRTATLIAILLIIVSGSHAHAAESASDETRLAGTTDSNGQHFEISDSEYLNVVLDSSQPIHLRMESVPKMITLFIESSDSALGKATIAIKGLSPDTTYYKYQDGYRTLEVFTTDTEGSYVFDQDITQAHVIFIQPRKSTKFISGTATGGDCPNIGIWDLETKTCVLTMDVFETIQVENGVTLDGNGHSVTGTMTGNGIYAGNDIVLKNLTIRNFVNGVFLSYTGHHTLTNNTIVGQSSVGIQASNSWDNVISNNYIGSNRTGVSLGGTRNTLIGNTVTLNTTDGISAGNVTGSVITNNVVTNNKLDGIVMSNSRGNTIGNNISNANRNGISLLFSYDNVLRDNVAQENTDLDFSVSAPDFDRQCDNTVENMTGSGGREIKYFNRAVSIENETLSGLILCNADNSTVRNVGIEGSALLKNNGLVVSRTDASTIDDVNSSGNKYGIFLTVSNGNTLTNNNVSSNNKGFQINFSNDNSITQNTIASNFEGVAFGQSSLNNTLSANNIISNSMGIYLLFGSNNNKLYNNNFVSNQQSVYISGSSGNIFNLPKPVGGNYWSDFDTSAEGCRDLNSDSFCDSALFLSVGRDEFPWTVRDGWSQPKIPSTFWSQVKNAPNSWSLRKTYGTLNKPVDDVIKTVPNDWAIKVTSTTDAGGANVDLDGYRWYQVQDATDGATGWMAGKSLSTGEVYLDYDASAQADLEQKASAMLTTKAARVPVILSAVDTYQTQSNSSNSLYGGGGGLDGKDNFQKFIQGSTFPKELTLAIASQESSIIGFNNEGCATNRDGGIGIMQITTTGSKGLGSALLNNPRLSDCRPGGDAISKYYSNVWQGIYANIKDGFRSLQDKYSLVGKTKAVDDITAGEMKAISTVYRYNQGSPYEAQAVYEIWNGQSDNYVWDEYLKYLSWTRASADVWMQKVRTACTPATTFSQCLTSTEVANLTQSAFYLREVGKRLVSSPFGTSYQNPVYGNKLIAANNSQLILFLRSPAELRLVDNNTGEITGSVNGESHEDIANSVYVPEQKAITLFFPREEYKYRVVGLATGVYGLSVDFVNNGEHTFFDADYIPTHAGEIHDYTIDWDKMSRCEQEAVTVEIDYNGDGIVDRTIKNDCRLTDIEPPIISITSPTGAYTLDSQAQVNFTATDALSGIATVSAKLNGTPVDNGQTITLTKPGTNSLEVTATDNEGNTAQATSTFQVLYTASGFLPPIKSDGTGIYNHSRTLPVKFSLADANGNPVSNAVAHLYVAQISNGIAGTDEIPLSTSAADSEDNIFRLSSPGAYIYNLSTDMMTMGTWQIKAVLDSGQSISAIVSIK